jgi:hypothetical protein
MEQQKTPKKCGDWGNRIMILLVIAVVGGLIFAISSFVDFESSSKYQGMLERVERTTQDLQ